MKKEDVIKMTEDLDNQLDQFESDRKVSLGPEYTGT